ncbi:hypothetical protein BDZ88DRAFT_41750 [Geranomyces variabilis]|nr:hypothetical protein BDZ88DRAFT_41750 [Geranomyces variabilis]
MSKKNMRKSVLFPWRKSKLGYIRGADIPPVPALSCQIIHNTITTMQYMIGSSSSFELPSGKAAHIEDLANIFAAEELSASTLHRDAKGAEASVSHMFANEELFQYPPTTKNNPRPRRSSKHATSTTGMPCQAGTPLFDPLATSLDTTESLEPALDNAASAVNLPRSSSNVKPFGALPGMSKGLSPSALQHLFAAAVKCGHFLTPESEEPVELEGSIFEPWETAPARYALLRTSSSVATN